MNKEMNDAIAKWNFTLNKLPVLGLTAEEELRRRSGMKRAKSYANESELEAITVLFDLNVLYANENQFFYEHSVQSLCVSLAEDLVHRRLGVSRSLPICLTGLYENLARIPVAKIFIQAECEVLQKLSFQSRGFSFETNFKPAYRDKFQTVYSNVETLLIGPTKLQYLHKVVPSQYCKGDYTMLGIGSYRECCLKLIDLKLSSEQIASLALNFLSNGIPVCLENLVRMQTDRKYSQMDVDFLNRLIYICFIKDVAKHMLPEDNNDVEKMPLATAQAMALIMMRHGILDYTEVINGDARYGVYTSSKHILEPKEIEKTKEKVKRIFRKYQKYQAEWMLNDQERMATDPNLKLEDEFMILNQVYGEENINDLQAILSDSMLKKCGLQKYQN